MDLCPGRVLPMISKILRDKESLLSLITQFFNLLLPLGIMYLLNTKVGVEGVIQFELVLSLVAFFSVLQDFSTSYLFSFRRFGKQIVFKYFCTLVVFKFMLTLLCVFIIGAMFYIFGGEPKIYVLGSFILLLTCFDIPLIFFSEGKSYLHSLLCSLKNLICFVFIFLGVDGGFSLLFSYVFFAIVMVFKYYSPKSSQITVSKRTVFYLFKKFRLITFTEVITAVFSQLDSYLVSLVASDKTIYVYVTVRKVIRAANVIMNYLFRISFMRYKKRSVNWKEPVYLIFILSSLMFVGFNLLGLRFFEFYSSIVFDPEIVSLTIFIQSMILFVGTLKSLIRNLYFFSSSMFKHHFVLTIISSLIFVMPLLFAFVNDFLLTSVQLSLYRISSDVFYLAFATGIYYFKVGANKGTIYES